MREEGVAFQTGVHVGSDLTAAELRKSFDAVLLCLGAEHPRDLPVEGRNLAGIHFAMEFLPQATKRVHGDVVPSEIEIMATGKHVIVLGGGDTGSDCVGTMIARGSSSHDEGGERMFALTTKRFSGSNGRVERLHGVRVQFGEPDASGRSAMTEVPGSEFEMKADLVLLALGFLGPNRAGLLEEMGLKVDPRGNVEAGVSDFRTSEPGVFAAGDCRRGQSLVVWAQWEGREAARAVDRFLMGESRLQQRSTAGNFPG
jgi:glutamate synthase (NADPH/NADH) small chain